MTISFPGESAAYRAARDRLLDQEVELRRATEAVAASRRSLPPGGAIKEDYVFNGASPTESQVGNAGRITSTSTTARQIQIALKLIW